jgi:hypothetical protein
MQGIVERFHRRHHWGVGSYAGRLLLAVVDDTILPWPMCDRAIFPHFL